MPTSTLQKSRRRNAIAPLKIETEGGANYLIKLVNVADAKDQILIYVKGGEAYSTKVPLGSYRVRGASGHSWYGRNDLFGPDTRFFRLKDKRGEAVDEAKAFHFRQKGNVIYGLTLSLKKAVEGNMEQETIRRDEF